MSLVAHDDLPVEGGPTKNIICLDCGNPLAAPSIKLTMRLMVRGIPKKPSNTEYSRTSSSLKSLALRGSFLSIGTPSPIRFLNRCAAVAHMSGLVLQPSRYASKDILSPAVRFVAAV